MVATICAWVGLTLAAAPGQPPSLDDAFANVTSRKDVHAAVEKAAVLISIENPPYEPEGGTGFFVWKRGADGRQRVFLVTAAHVFENANPGVPLQVVARRKTNRGACETERWRIPMHDRERKPLWLEDKNADIAVLEMGRDRVPCVAISVNDLATPGAGSVGLGDLVFAVGYPSGGASSSFAEGNYGMMAEGRVAERPVYSTPGSTIEIFFDAFLSEGYSGAPVYWIRGSGEGSSGGTVRPRPVVVGVVTGGWRQPLADGGLAYIRGGLASLAAYAVALIERAK